MSEEINKIQHEYGTKEGWKYQRTGNKYAFQKKITLSGSAENIDLTVPFSFRLDRIEYFSNDTTAKSFTERIFSGDVDTSSYDQIVNASGDINQAIAYRGDESDHYLMNPLVIRTSVSASTAAKTLTKKITVTRLV